MGSESRIALAERRERRFRLRALLLCATLAAGVTAAGCVGAPDGVPVVQNFDLSRYLGTWYEIARLDHSFERGLRDVTARYALRDDGGVRVLNRGYDPDKQAWKEAEGRAYFVKTPNIGELKVSFFGPFYGGYNIIALDDDYRYALICGPTRDYLWILARVPKPDPTIVRNLVSRAAELGFATDALIYGEQTRP